MNQYLKASGQKKHGHSSQPPSLLVLRLWGYPWRNLAWASLITFVMSFLITVSVANPFEPISLKTQGNDGIGLASSMSILRECERLKENKLDCLLRFDIYKSTLKTEKRTPQEMNIAP